MLGGFRRVLRRCSTSGDGKVFFLSVAPCNGRIGPVFSEPTLPSAVTGGGLYDSACVDGSEKSDLLWKQRFYIELASSSSGVEGSRMRLLRIEAPFFCDTEYMLAEVVFVLYSCHLDRPKMSTPYRGEGNLRFPVDLQVDVLERRCRMN